jgi:uncharacterized 2Fe-2S/4Fe-4S cluster protein (DUF4445 family)
MKTKYLKTLLLVMSISNILGKSPKYRQVGNAAGTGARLVLLSTEQRARATQIARRVNYIELTAEPGFAAEFARALLLR